MATIRLTVLNSIKGSDGRLPVLVCISQKGKRAYIKTEFLINDIAEFDNGKVVYRKDANIMNKRMGFVFSQYKEKYDSCMQRGKQQSGGRRIAALDCFRIL